MSHLDYEININGYIWTVVDKSATNTETYPLRDVLRNGGRKPQQVSVSFESET